MQTVVVLLTPAADIRNLTGTRTFSLPNGRACLIFNYDVIRLWQTSAATILNGPTGLLPLALLCKASVKIESMIAEMDRRIQAEATIQEAETLWAATYFLMGLRFDPETVAKLIPKGKAMKESTTYQAILKEGRDEGIDIGRDEGRKEGRQVILEMLLRLGNNRFGEPTVEAQERMKNFSLEQLRNLSERLTMVETWSEFLSDEEPSVESLNLGEPL